MSQRYRRLRRGQSEVVGGLIVLTLMFMFAIPIILDMYYTNVQAGQQVQARLQEARANLNERLAIGSVNPNSEAARRAGWIPGVWINNTGTTTVQLDKLYLVNDMNNSIFIVYDLTWTRPINTTYIKKMIINPDEGPKPVPPPGTPIILRPGDKLLIVFNESILPVASQLLVRVESASGVLHPIGEGGGAPRLYPGRPGEQAVETGAWRGIFAPLSGFKLIGFNDIVNFSNVWTVRGCYRINEQGRSYSGWAISNDADNPPFYELEYSYYWSPRHLKAFIGTFDFDSEDNINVRVDGWYGGTPWTDICLVEQDNWNTIFWDRTGYPGNWKAFTYSDMDSNGVNELTFFTYWIHYYGGEDLNPDSDGDGDKWSDSLAGVVQVARDISGVDFIRVSAKVIYDISLHGDGSPNNPMKVFSIVIWRYDDGDWRIIQAKDFDFVNFGPKTFEIGALFPVNRTDTYRIGVVFYDPYKRIYDGAYYEFMMGLEHLIVEYGVLNPLFFESPPLYIVAIPDPDLIGEIGEQEYMASKNISDVDIAKVRAQADLLAKIEEELNYAGVAGYTIIKSPSELCDLLFSDQTPKYAIIYWLQGNVSFDDVAREAGCSVSDAQLASYISTYHWVLVWPFGEPFGNRHAIDEYNPYVSIGPPTNTTMNITMAGLNVRKKYYAFYLFNQIMFKYPVEFDSDYVVSNYVLLNATFYTTTGNYTADSKFGTVSFWLHEGVGSGVIVLNPVHVDWDLSGDGASPSTIAQQVVYSSLLSWIKLLGG